LRLRTRQFLLVIAAQTVCLAVGLWMQHRFTVASVGEAVEAEAWSDIESTLDSAFAELRQTEPVGATIAEDRLGAAFETVARHWGRRAGEVMIVDADWQVILPAPQAADVRIKWTPMTDAHKNRTTSIRGRLNLGGEVHIAVARALPGRRGFLIAHYPRARFESSTAVLVSALPAVGGLTFLWTCALLSLAVYVVLARLHDDIDKERSENAQDALRQTQSLLRTRDAVIFGLAKLAEYRDPETGDHLERISTYSTMLAGELRRHPEYHHRVTPAFIRLIGISSALHDIGKVGIDDSILRKPGRLTPEEYTSMQVHTKIGGECLQEIEQRLHGSNFLQMAREIAYAHHEQWDGAGYPFGLAGKAIPLSARIVALVDNYDALSSRRVYKEPYPHEKCVAIIREEAGKKLDPNLVAVWLQIEHKFKAVSEQYAEPQEPSAERDAAALRGTETARQEAEELCVPATGTSTRTG